MLRWIRSLFGGAPREEESPLPYVEGRPGKYGMEFDSERGAMQRTPKERFVFYGHAGDSNAALFPGLSTLYTIHINSLSALEAYLNSHEIAGLAAMSRVERVGEAGEAIRLLRTIKGPGVLALYGAWDYNVARGATRAIEYGANGVLMPAIDINDQSSYLFNMMALAQKGMKIPTSVEEHEFLLRQFCQRSGFWDIQDVIVSEYY